MDLLSTSRVGTYPIEVVNLLSSLNNELPSMIPFSTFFLLGSAARYELSYTHNPDGTLELFSDLEFLIVTDNPFTHKQRDNLQTFIRAQEKQFLNPNPLFHIDLLTRTRRRLRKLPPFIFTYEMQHTALLLAGNDLRAEIPDVTLDNLDYRNTHEILYKRLWAMLLYLPKRFILQQMSEPEARVAGYVLCRNALDLTTVLLPHVGVLLPSYQKRVAYVQDHFAELPFLQALGRDFASFLRICLERRRDLDFSSMDLYAHYARVMKYLEKGFLCLHPELFELTALPAYSSTLYNEWPLSRGEWYNLARLNLQWMRTRGPRAALNWLRRPKKGWLTVGLWAMHRALLSWFAGDISAAEEYLGQAIHSLRSLHVAPVTISAPTFIDRWLATRVVWGEFWRDYIRLGAVSYIKRFKYVMEWTHE